MKEKQEREVSRLLPTVPLPFTEDDHHLHAPGAPLTLLEFGDFASEHCAVGRHVVQELLADLGDDLCFVFRNFPETDRHPIAQFAAEAAEAADLQGKFWLMHDRLFEHQAELSPTLIRQLAKELPIDLHHFDRDLTGGEPRRRVAADVTEATRAGVEATPTFFVNGRMHVGSYEYHPLRDALQDARRRAP
jgi:protein-disulfide isomerase